MIIILGGSNRSVLLNCTYFNITNKRLCFQQNKGGGIIAKMKMSTKNDNIENDNVKDNKKR
jgi:hypothetical protein